ncbi:Glucose/arabinose dehydrogenase, beta-propeller fold [Micromonospora pattaloongensis]|uniref:Glucose/arabinose dehydrogenase, beta-propeller fold n=1 Tax=Micromonospora pattaloongensis TaxID=405436 RepID=A0A1H3LVX9_9ACTN|nr:PQQ-dependent sugar dehydrogenase [Micromonospora pattaloongensis]SDY68138.1 Glucose/arabinose dehydrogenase, beta-propeller fold [Micromonospora pattaloongensis]
MRRTFGRLGVTAAVALLAPLVLSAAPAARGAAPAAPAAAVPLDQLTVTTTQVASGLRRPTAIVAPDDGSRRLLITEKAGTVRTYHPESGLAADTLLDLTDRVDTSGNERGLLGIATSPRFAQTRALYVAYTALPDGRVTLSRFRLDRADQTPVPPAREEILLTQPHAEYPNHNGGQLAFGPDGYLYWSLGDGGGADDVLNTGQNLGTLLGKILRLDVGCAGRPYCVPADNPFVGTAGARPEIWAYGLRNPWKFSFDPQDGSLWIADVGQGTYEEVDHLARGRAGANLGWSCREGPQVFNPDRCVPGAQYVEAVFSYRTSTDGCAVIGGHVYRGRQFADLAAGTYLATDYCSGTAFAIRPASGGGYATRPLGELTIQPTTLGVDADGEFYLANDLPGQLHRISFGTTAPAATCAVTYKVDSQWGTGFTATVTVTNTGSQPVNGWTVGWTFPGPQRASNWWNAVGSQQGAAVTARNANWNATIAPGGSVSFGFLGTPGGAQPAPTTFTLNGAACR